jgi:flagellar biogenesis protein FliO
MNKDVIYIEPEDDITDIITKIEKSKEKIVALVPPKKAGVFRSIVNIKLIAKAGATSEKKVVLVTVDPSIIKLAATTKLPVAKSLQSAPEIPELETKTEPEENQTIENLLEDEDIDEAEYERDTNDSDRSRRSDRFHHKSGESDDDDDYDERNEDEETENEEDEKKDKKAKKSGKKGNKAFDWIKSHKKTSIFLGIFALGLIGFLIWALVFAPAVDIAVAIKTDSKNFSENVTFTKTATEENAKEGKFYLQEKKLEETQEVNFEATGQKNQGSKAAGDVVVEAYFSLNVSGSVSINAGTVFKTGGLSYTANNSTTLTYDGNGTKNCDNYSTNESGDGECSQCSQCLISTRMGVTAAEGGSNYNIGASSNWSTAANVQVYSDKAMTGGTDDIKTVVQQSDIEKAKSELTTAKEEENKKKLYESIGDEYYIIESSFAQSTSSAEATPGADQEVGSSKPVLKATTTSTVYVIEKSKLEEFIAEKASLEDGQKIYETKDIYVENFTEGKSSITGRLKAQYYIGPKITETEVVEKIKGKGLGDAQREIRDFYGVSNVTINPSYPWVMTIPGDSNKVNIQFEVKDKDGNEVKDQRNSEKGDSSSSDNSDGSNSNESGN